MNDTLKSLHKKFNSTTCHNISYALFCRLRPFYVVYQKHDARDTCMCKLCTNTDLIVHALLKKKVVSQVSGKNLAKTLCCDGDFVAVNCLQRKCKTCAEKQLVFVGQFDGDEIVKYEQWEMSKATYKDKSGKMKMVKVVAKLIKKEKLINLVKKLQDVLLIFMSHEANFINQFAFAKKIKYSLKPNEVLLHIDFSENYSMKYAQEIQSFHFGGSRKQVSLHTSSLYLRPTVYEEVQTKSFGTLSLNLNHGPVGIVAHLLPILNYIKDRIPDIATLHFLSDGPSSQYRNQLMFYWFKKMVDQFLPTVHFSTWSYQEAGHGKGAPDGIGGTIKRTADRLVGEGKDLNTFEVLIDQLKLNLRKVEIAVIPEDSFERIQKMVVKEDVVSFKGTMKVHQVVYDKKKNQKKLQMKSLSCLKCDSMCSHFELGSILYKTIIQNESHVEIDDSNKEQEVISNKDQEKINFTWNDLRVGQYILVKFQSTGKTQAEYRYVSDVRKKSAVK